MSRKRYWILVSIGLFPVMLLVLAIATPNWVGRRGCGGSPMNSCINNLRALDGAKQQWALEEHKTTNEAPNMTEIAQFIPAVGMRAVPSCPAGGVYTLGRVCENPKCSMKGHELP